MTPESADFLKAVNAAIHALRSYQHGNSSPDLAEEIADVLEKAIVDGRDVGAAGPTVKMTIDEALRAASQEYDEECRRARRDPGFSELMNQCLFGEYKEINRQLPEYVGAIAAGLGVKVTVPDWAYQMAIMCFRMGMRTQRKLDRPSEPTSSFWRSDKTAV